MGLRGVRVNGIAPDLVGTKFAKVLWGNDAMRGAVERAAALGRIVEPEDIARAPLFLVSDLASHMAGQTLIDDDGGRSPTLSTRDDSRIGSAQGETIGSCP
jgi:3-oxoacyl-[acyl-carrier protein] reductase